MGMAGKIKIQIVSKWSTIITIVLFVTSIGMAVWGHQQYNVLRSSMQDYIDCRSAVQELQQGSDILTKQCGWLPPREIGNISQPILKKPM